MTGKPGMLQSVGLQRVRHDLVTEQQQLYLLLIIIIIILQRKYIMELYVFHTLFPLCYIYSLFTYIQSTM